ncbi:hypothetical protein CC78DRAFT_583464 [Lojkania enalia]|uniref:Uncharacterized protein n=1 Tax=Lojkania enalia TaxID=147567 RepID=A0A9P4K2C1_9PLEO|nr:hypothetical protein CC78DRAFT_583464 [Didymosphaeria enalia]
MALVKHIRTAHNRTSPVPMQSEELSHPLPIDTSRLLDRPDCTVAFETPHPGPTSSGLAAREWMLHRQRAQQSRPGERGRMCVCERARRTERERTSEAGARPHPILTSSTSPRSLPAEPENTTPPPPTDPAVVASSPFCTLLAGLQRCPSLAKIAYPDARDRTLCPFRNYSACRPCVLLPRRWSFAGQTDAFPHRRATPPLRD